MILSGFALLLLLSLGNAANQKAIIAVVREEPGHHGTESSIRERIRRDIGDNPAEGIRATVHITPGDLNVRGAWTLLPLFPKLADIHPDASWVVFMRESTRFNWTRLAGFLKGFDPSKEWFIGHELFDSEASIVHHFAFHHDPASFKFPHLESGVIVSQPVLMRVSARLGARQLPRDFAIDPAHELAVYVMDGVNLTHSATLCDNNRRPDCATWIQPFEPCGILDESKLQFAVKTCSKYHADRVSVVKQTWARHAKNVAFFSDTSDERIPTVFLGVPNTETGHCAKTMAIIKHLAERRDHDGPYWFVIADDDTILGVRKLREFLTCYDPNRPVLIGQKYGYASGYDYGYDYITGGGGMVLSGPAIKLMASRCRCPRADTPDDMWLGACAEHARVPIVHFAGFHQARPDDYPAALLRSQFVVSFHKHWMIDPLVVYEQWFAEATADEAPTDAPLQGPHDPTRLFKMTERGRDVLPDEL